MNEMVAIVAQELLDHLVGTGEGIVRLRSREHRLTDVKIDGTYDLEAIARAAIAAMREPSHEMIEAGWADALALGRLDAIWQTMIDAALSD